VTPFSQGSPKSADPSADEYETPRPPIPPIILSHTRPVKSGQIRANDLYDRKLRECERSENYLEDYLEFDHYLDETGEPDHEESSSVERWDTMSSEEAPYSYSDESTCTFEGKPVPTIYTAHSEDTDDDDEDGDDATVVPSSSFSSSKAEVAAHLLCGLSNTDATFDRRSLQSNRSPPTQPVGATPETPRRPHDAASLALLHLQQPCGEAGTLMGVGGQSFEENGRYAQGTILNEVGSIPDSDDYNCDAVSCSSQSTQNEHSMALNTAAQGAKIVLDGDAAAKEYDEYKNHRNGGGAQRTNAKHHKPKARVGRDHYRFDHHPYSR